MPPFLAAELICSSISHAANAKNDIRVIWKNNTTVHYLCPPRQVLVAIATNVLGLIGVWWVRPKICLEELHTWRRKWGDDYSQVSAHSVVLITHTWEKGGGRAVVDNWGFEAYDFIIIPFPILKYWFIFRIVTFLIFSPKYTRVSFFETNILLLKPWITQGEGRV